MKECRKDGCSKPRVGRGLCSTHYRALERKLKTLGQWESVWEIAYTDTGPVREHIELLRSRGVGWPQLAKLTGVAARTLHRIGEGSPTVRKRTAAIILAVPVPDIPHSKELADGARVSALGSRRRLRALVAMGHRLEDLAQELGLKDRSAISKILGGSATQVSALRARQIDDLFLKYQLIPGKSLKCKEWGKRRGWAVPFAWNEDTIDDPDAVPDTGENTVLTFPERLEEVRDLGITNPHEQARMLGYDTLRSFDRQLDRLGLRETA